MDELGKPFLREWSRREDDGYERCQVRPERTVCGEGNERSAVRWFICKALVHLQGGVIANRKDRRVYAPYGGGKESMRRRRLLARGHAVHQRPCIRRPSFLQYEHTLMADCCDRRPNIAPMSWKWRRRAGSIRQVGAECKTTTLRTGSLCGEREHLAARRTSS